MCTKNQNFEYDLRKRTKYKTKAITNRKLLKCKSAFFLLFHNDDLIDKDYQKKRTDVIKGYFDVGIVRLHYFIMNKPIKPNRH